jgi:putative transposase
VPARVSPSERIRAQIDDLFADPDRELGAVLEDVARLSVRLVFQAALEAEVTEFLGRERYARADRARAGSRNGYGDITVKTTAGPVALKRPKLRGTDEAFASRLLGRQVTRTNALEAVVISGWVRGLSDRDIEAALAEALGPEAALSRSTVSRICQQIRAEFDVWKGRDLSAVELEYLYVDASHFRYHQGSRAEPVLVAYGLTTTGKPVLLALDGASAESVEACLGFLRDLVGRGLRSPLLVISDGAPGLIAALEQVFPHSLRQRCLVHRLGNILAKVAAADQHAVKANYWAIFDNITAEPGQPAVDQARQRARVFAERWADRYPRAVKAVIDELPYLTAHLRLPREHWRRVRHTNLIERTFGESRRRVKVIGRLPGERSCLSLLWAVLDRASAGWRGVDMNPANARRLQRLRSDLFHPDQQPKDANDPSQVTPAA